MNKHRVAQLLYGNEDIFKDFNPLPSDIQGWSSTAPIFDQLIREVKPRFIVEVGTWKGASAIHMDSLCRQAGLDTTILCVDTFLGSLDFWGENKSPVTDLRLKNGYPTIYYQFLSNVVHTGSQNTIIPFPATSTMAALFLKKYHLYPDLIYIDGSHEYEDVINDIRHYMDVIMPGGIIFGDDYKSYYGVQKAVNEMKTDARVKSFCLSHPDEWHWVMRF